MFPIYKRIDHVAIYKRGLPLALEALANLLVSAAYERHTFTSKVRDLGQRVLKAPFQL